MTDPKLPDAVEQLKLIHGAPVPAKAVSIDRIGWQFEPAELKTRAIGYAYALTSLVYPALEPMISEASIQFSRTHASEDGLKNFIVEVGAAAVRVMLSDTKALDAWQSLLTSMHGITAKQFDELTEGDHTTILLAVLHANQGFFARAATPKMKASLIEIAATLSTTLQSMRNSKPSASKRKKSAK